MSHVRMQSARDTARRSLCSHPGLEALEGRRLLANLYVVTNDSLVRAGRDSFVPVAEVYGEPGGDQVVSATINWGDGSAPAKTTDYYYNPNDPSGRHTYLTPGKYQATETLTVQGTGHANYSLSGSAIVEVVPQVLVTTNEGPLHVRRGDSTEGDTPITFVTDIDKSDLKVTVDWGDRTAPAAATLTQNQIYPVGGFFGTPYSLIANGGQAFDVHGDHVFTSAGDYTAHMTITGPAGSTEVDVPVVVTDGPIEVDPGPIADDPPGYAAPFTIGHVQDLANVLSPYGNIPYALSVDWGDGTPVEPVQGSIYPYAPVYHPGRHVMVDVGGTHTYALPGDYTATLHVVTPDGFAAQAGTKIHVERETLTLDGTTATTTPGVEQIYVVAAGTDSFQHRTDSDVLNTTIDWGDGSLGTYQDGRIFETGTASGPGTLRIFDPHTYDKPGVYDIHVTTKAVSGASAETDSTLTVLPFQATANNLIGVAGVPTASQTLATVGLPDRDSDPSTYSATINWGDGSAIQAALIGTQTLAHDPWLGLPGPRVVATVLGSHAYASAGTYYATIVVTGPGGASRKLVTTATIAQPRAAPLIPVVPPVTTTPTVTAPPRGHYVEVYQFGHPDQMKRVWVADVATASVPPKPRHHPRGPRHPHRSS